MFSSANCLPDEIGAGVCSRTALLYETTTLTLPGAVSLTQHAHGARSSSPPPPHPPPPPLPLSSSLPLLPPPSMSPLESPAKAFRRVIRLPCNLGCCLEPLHRLRPQPLSLAAPPPTPSLGRACTRPAPSALPVLPPACGPGCDLGCTPPGATPAPAPAPQEGLQRGGPGPLALPAESVAERRGIADSWRCRGIGAAAGHPLLVLPCWCRCWCGGWCAPGACGRRSFLESVAARDRMIS